MLKVDSISKKFSQFELNKITFQVQKGDYFMLLGPSGAGKSVILEIIAGLIRQDEGEIFVNGEKVSFRSIGRRNIGLVFQDLAIFPNMNVFQNIGYSLRRKGIKGVKEKEIVNSMAKKLSIDHLLFRNPASLSGGELQRVALARTLVLEPKVLLLDEPLSSIDVQIRSELKALLRALNREGQTILHVTHDYDEAISLGNQVAVVNNGEIVQTGTPVEVFRNPASEFVANFSGIKNFYQGSIGKKTEHDLVCFSTNGIEFWLYSSDNVSSGFICFPEDHVTISLVKPENSAVNAFKGLIYDIFQQKHGLEVWIDCGIKIASLITWESLEKLGLKTGQEVWVSVKASAIRFIPRA